MFERAHNLISEHPPSRQVHDSRGPQDNGWPMGKGFEQKNGWPTQFLKDLDLDILGVRSGLKKDYT